ncbi:MAG: helix-turn-helix domain-containing protein [Oscillospiraceae bacterium]|nr:helix-turn-helix domain-containing protein [Oscillospiraceae bacterium]
MFLQRLEDLRIDRDKKQQDIADVLHCKLTVYWRYEKGERAIPVWALMTLADYYGVSTDYILGRTDKPNL